MMFCNNSCCCGCQNNCRATPIVAPRKVCTKCTNQYVEQPIICPIECRHVYNVVYYPRYYPRYEQTYFTQSNGNPFTNAGFNGNNSGYNTNVTNGSCGCGN